MNRRLENFIWDVIMYILAAAIIALFLYLVCGCSPRYITVPEYHYENIHTVDTFLQRDSILKENNTVIREADSTMLADLGIRLKAGERAILVLRKELEKIQNQQKEVVRDTVVKVDSINVPYPVEKQLTRWQSLKMEAGGYLFVLLIVLAIVLIVIAMKNKGIIFRRPRDGL